MPTLRPILRFLPAILLAVTLATIVAACGSSNKGSGYDTSRYGGNPFVGAVVEQHVVVSTVVGNPYAWDKTSYTANAGDVTFDVQNPGKIIHQFGVEGAGVKYESGNLQPETNYTFTVRGLQPGAYHIVCNFPGHKENGMVATLTVK